MQYKANGKNFSDGFTLFNTPELQAARNQNLTDVNVMRAIEIGLKYRF